eukprot:SAG25_NODE_73_length_17157_cov_11.762575_11_plen_163_part_00
MDCHSICDSPITQYSHRRTTSSTSRCSTGTSYYGCVRYGNDTVPYRTGNIEARNRKLGHINRLPTKPKRWIHGMPEMELWYDEHTTAEQRQNWREYYNKLVVTGQARSEPPNSWYEQQRAAAVQTEKQKLQFNNFCLLLRETASQTVSYGRPAHSCSLFQAL